MASGLPDYYRGIDLAYQSLTTAAIDIVAQTLSNISVDIAAQTLANINVDLAAQTLGQLNIDIIAQTLSNLNIDVNAQSLGQLTNRPKYGGAVGSTGSLVVTASSENELVSVDGKGMIYGGTVWLDYTSTQNNSMPLLEIDGSDIVEMSFGGGALYSIDKPRCYPIVLLKCDNTNFVYAAGISYGLTFETGVKLKYKEEHGTTPDVGFTLVYALI